MAFRDIYMDIEMVVGRLDQERGRGWLQEPP